MLSALFLAAPVASAEEPAKTIVPTSTLPTAKTEGSTFAVEDDAVVVTTGKSTVRLHPIAAAIFALSDGKRSIDAIRKGAEEATGYPVDEPTVFAALDALADAKLISARVTPPGGETELDLVVVADGTDAKELVAKATSKSPGADWTKVKASEEKAKRAVSEKHKSEAAEKRTDTKLKAAEEDRKKAFSAYGAGRVKQEQALKAKTAKAGDEKMLGAQRTAAESAAKSERVLRKKLALREMDKKKQPQKL